MRDTIGKAMKTGHSLQMVQSMDKKQTEELLSSSLDNYSEIFDEFIKRRSTDF